MISKVRSSGVKPLILNIRTLIYRDYRLISSKIAVNTSTSLRLLDLLFLELPAESEILLRDRVLSPETSSASGWSIAVLSLG